MESSVKVKKMLHPTINPSIHFYEDAYEKTKQQYSETITKNSPSGRSTDQVDKEDPEPASVVGDVGSCDKVPVSPTCSPNWPYEGGAVVLPPSPPTRPPPSNGDSVVGDNGVGPTS